MDRPTASMHIAKVFAFLACGKRELAVPHIAALLRWLENL